MLLSQNQKSPVPIPHKDDLKIGRFENYCTIEKLKLRCQFYTELIKACHEAVPVICHGGIFTPGKKGIFYPVERGIFTLERGKYLPWKKKKKEFLTQERGIY